MNNGLLGLPKRAAVGGVFWDPDAPPSSPTSFDDEFETPSLSSRWTPVNWSGFTTVDYHTSFPGHLYVDVPNTSNTMHALVQALPAGDFTAWLRLRAMPTAMPWTGMVLSTAAAAESGTQTLIMCYEASGSTEQFSVGVYDFTNFNSTATLNVADKLARYGAPILRLRKSGGSWSYGFGYDGRTWYSASFTPSGTPAYFGLGLISPSGQKQVAIDYVRVRESAVAQTGALRASI